MKNNTENILFEKLNNFINKFYKNQLIKGVIITITTFLIFFISFSVLEYFSHSGRIFRTLLFWIYILINAFTILKFIIIPLLHLYRFGDVLNYKKAAKIIGEHFSEIDDKLLNILQLGELSGKDNDLINASIQQKIDKIKSISFSNAINFGENKKHIKWASLPILFLILFFVSGNKHILTESSARIIDYKNEYIPLAPFSFDIKNNELSCVQHQDFILEINMSGMKIPNKIYIEIGGNKFSLMKNSVYEFEHLFKNVISDVNFRFYADGFYSQYYTLVSIPKPIILDFNIELKFPKYTNFKNEKLENIGDLSIPEGTQIHWNFNLQHTDSLYFNFENEETKFRIENDKLTVNKKAKKNSSYNISTSNNFISTEKIDYKIQIIKDQFPHILVNSILDSNENIFSFDGTISDDYQLRKLEFHYTITSDDSSSNFTEEINIQKNSKENFYYFLDVNNLNLNASDKITYYFEVWDNDRINGSKSVKSKVYHFTEFSEEEEEAKKEKVNTEIKNNLDESINLAKKIKKDIEQLNKDLIEKKNLGWEEKQKVKSILKKQKQLENQIKENNKKNSDKNQFQKKMSSSILEKQKQLEKLMNEVMDDESKKMMEEMQKLLEEMNKEKMKKLLDEMDKENTDLEKELDRNLELFKQLEFEQKLEETIEKIDQLKENQENLKNKTDDKKSDTKKLASEQEKLQKELKDLENDLKNLEEKNSELEEKNNLPKTEEEEKEASESMEESKKSLENKQKKKSSKQQEKAIEQLDEMSEKLKELLTSSSESKPMEDMETLRQILENLITLSFNQEELIKSIESLPINSPSIVKYIQQQKKLADDSKIIEDSLLALSKRVIQIESIINKEISSINYNMQKSTSLLEERQLNKGVAKQQFVMTAANNLALLLSETLKQMQMDLANKKPGSKQCNKPGSGSKPSLSEMKKQQKKLMGKMKGQKGKKGKKNGKEGNKSNNQYSMQIMQMAQQQEKIRQQLQDLRDEIGENGNKGNLDRIIEKMEENETDILNNNITNETLLRQEEILTRLLEAENAERERDEEKKRESIEWEYEIENKNSDYIEYLKIKQQQEELLKTSPVQLSPFYKNKVNDYFNEIIKED